ncbi:TPA: DNA-directed RNA polymerase, partial [Enterococcus faecium]|nr:DNA-directed RNA polymerase [Enterococcus faecium]
MKKKFITGGIVVAFLCLIGYTGTRYANEIILWGGETDIDTINENLTQLDHTL